jgi:hypothetical protein
VGGTIVAEVVLGLMACDPDSYFNANPGFDPGPGYGMGDFLLWADAIDPRAFEPAEEEDELEDEPAEEELDEDELDEDELDEEPHLEEPETELEEELATDQGIDPAASSPVPGAV